MNKPHGSWCPNKYKKTRKNKIWLSEYLKLIMDMIQLTASVQPLSCPTLCDPRPPCPIPTPGDYPNPCPLSQWCHPITSFSVVPFSSCLQSFPASGSFQMSQLFASGGQSTGVLASTSVLQMNTQDWSALDWTGWISLQSKELSRVLPNTTVHRE